MSNGKDESETNDTDSVYKSMLNTTLGLEKFQFDYLFNEEDDESFLASPLNPTSPGKNNGQIQHETMSNRNSELQIDWETQQRQAQELDEKLIKIKQKFNQQETQWKQERQRLLSPNGTSQHFSLMNEPIFENEIETTTEDIEDLHRQVENLEQKYNKEKQELEDVLNKERDIKQEMEEENRALREVKEKQAKEIALLKQQIASQERQQLQEKYALEQALHQEEEAKQQLQNKIEILEKEKKQNVEEEEDSQQHAQWRLQIESMQQQIKNAVEDQTSKTIAFETRIQNLQDMHEEERMGWERTMKNYQDQLENNEITWKNELQQANKRYDDLHEKYNQEIEEWQTLLDEEVAKAPSNDQKKDTEVPQSIEAEHAREIEDLVQGLEKEKDNYVDLSLDFEKSELGESPNQKHLQHTIAQLSPIHSSNSSIRAEETASKQVVDESMHKNIDGLLQEIGQIDEERRAFLQEVGGDSSDPDNTEEKPEMNTVENDGHVQDDPQSTNSTDANSSQLLDTSLTLLNDLKELIDNESDSKEKELSIIQQLEVLSEMMNEESMVSDLASLVEKQLRHQTSEVANQLIVLEHPEGDSSFSGASKEKHEEEENPWPALVEELRNRCHFLENDRSELTRITNDMIERERVAHKIKVDAAVATAKREAMEELHLFQKNTREQMKNLFHVLCVRCQGRIYSAETNS